MNNRSLSFCNAQSCTSNINHWLECHTHTHIHTHTPLFYLTNPQLHHNFFYTFFVCDELLHVSSTKCNRVISLSFATFEDDHQHVELLTVKGKLNHYHHHYHDLNVLLHNIMWALHTIFKWIVLSTWSFVEPAYHPTKEDWLAHIILCLKHGKMMK